MKKGKAGKRTEPSRASLREMPEVNLRDGRWKRNPFAARIAAEGMEVPGMGRPKRGEAARPTVPRSIRFPRPVWARLESVAKANGMTLHAALRTAVAEWVGRHGT